MFQFLHVADIHLDSPLRGLTQYEGVPVEKMRGATRQAFKNLVEAAIERRVAFVVIAGDLYDGDSSGDLCGGSYRDIRGWHLTRAIADII